MLLNAMFEDLVLGQIFSDNAAEVWAKLKETYDKLDGLTPYGENLTLSAYGLSVLVLLEKISSLLSRENLPDVKDTFAIISKEESHRGIASYGSVFKPQVSSFMAKSNNWTNNENKRGDNNKFGNTVNFEPGPKQNGSKTFNANFASTSNEKGATLSFTNEQMMKLMNLINDVPSGNIQANMVDSGANQHVTISTTNMFGIIDIYDLNLTVGHLNGTLAKIKYVGNLRLSEKVVLFDVLVVPEYCVSLLSVNKLIKDNRIFVGFTETKCYIQDFHQNQIVGTASENGGLYLFDTPSSFTSKCQNL
ncbi:hypothetical protein Tco_1342590, partial [Tanacetum coccineum]